MRILDLFSGIGGFSLAGSWLGWETVQFVEWDSFCQKVLNKHWPNVPIHSDIKDFDGTKLKGSIDIICGGPPCQPASSAGKRLGEKDDRWLWPEAIRILGEVMPPLAVFENPDDLLSLDNGEPFERICCQMENIGYKVETIGIPACFVGSWQERDRIWIIANLMHDTNTGNLVNRKDTTKTKGGKRINKQKREASHGERFWIKPDTGIEAISDTHIQGLQGATQGQFRSVLKSNEQFKGCPINGTSTEIGLYWATEPGVGRMVHGIPNRVDRIKSLGNSIVPQVAYQIFKSIDHYIKSNQ